MEKKINSESIRLFSPPVETLNLILPCLLLLAALTEILFAWHLTFHAQFFLFAAISVFLGSGLHLAMSFVAAVGLPEMREALYLKGPNGPTLFFVKTGLVAALGFLAGLLTIDGFPISNTSLQTKVLLLFCLDWFLVYHHAISQVFGLTSMYNQNAKKTFSLAPSASRHLLRVEKMTKYTLQVLIFAVIISHLARNLGWSRFVPPNVFTGLHVFSFFLVGHVLWINGRVPVPGLRNKMIFMSRLILFPVMQFSAIAGIGYSLVHGTEHLCVHGKMFRACKKKSINLGFWLSIAFSGILISLLNLFYRNQLTFFIYPEGSQLMAYKFLACAAFACVFAHYYVDRTMFRMKDPEIRAQIGPLLSA